MSADLFTLSTIAALTTPLIALIVGISLIVVGARRRAAELSRRIDVVRGDPLGTAAAKVAGKPRRVEERFTPSAQDGVTEPEHRHIIRLYGGFGVKPESALSAFKTTRLALMLLLPLAALPFVMPLFAGSPALGLLVLAVPAVIGRFLPMIIIRKGIVRRCQAIGAGLPDALELLAVCIEAGLSLENGLHRVSRELKRAQPDLADELALTWAEMNILPDRDQALTNLAERVDIASIRSVVTTLSQTLRYGTPLAKSLRVVAEGVRSDQLTAMEEKANRLPAMMTVPVMLFIMPTIFLIVGGPAALKLMDVFFGK